MIPELEDLVDTGIVTKDTALAMIKNLSSNEQKYTQVYIMRLLVIYKSNTHNS